MLGQYSVLAPFYDSLNGGTFDYDGYADAVEKLLDKNGIPKGSLLLDLACGTGAMTLRLLKKGYDAASSSPDIMSFLSPEMLGVCRENCENEGFSPLLLCQDMCSLDLYGTVEAAVCCLDSVNYLTGDGELDILFSKLKNFISPGGLFIFDINTERKFGEIYANNVYTYDADGVFCVWQNSFDKKTRLCDFDLTFFIEEKKGLYRRAEEHQCERCYTVDEISAAAKNNRFTLEAVCSDVGLSPSDGSELRSYCICRRNKLQTFPA